MKHYTITLFALLFLVVSVSMVGCGSGRLRTEPVVGIVTLDGEPLEGASVNFIPKNPDEGIASFGRTDAKGEYRLQTLAGDADAGTLPGEYTVTISKHKLVPSGSGRMVVDFTTQEQVPEMLSVLIFPEMARYANPETTPFSVTVVKGRNRFDLDLQSR